MNKLSDVMHKELSELSSFLSERKDHSRKIEVKGVTSEELLLIDVGGLTSKDLSSAIRSDVIHDDKGERIQLILKNFGSTILNKKLLETEHLKCAIRYNNADRQDGEGLKILLEFATKQHYQLDFDSLLSTADIMDSLYETKNSKKIIQDFKNKASEIKIKTACAFFKETSSQIEGESDLQPELEVHGPKEGKPDFSKFSL